jgi:NAD(P)-dependent dehydrogenase (short-subunit alcohol dehydrogenase family)
MAINLTAYFLCIRHVVPEMLKVGGGRIINIGSVDGVSPLVNSTPYGVSKAGTHFLTISAAQDLAPSNITVNCIMPSGFASHIYDRLQYQKRKDGTYGLATEEVVDRFERRNNQWALGKVPLPEEMAAAAVFLAGDEASYITGHIMMLDGGRTVLWLRRQQ